MDTECWSAPVRRGSPVPSGLASLLPQTPVLAMGDSTTNRSMFPLFGMHSAPGSEPRSPQATDSQIDAAVILGAGFDTRAYRLPVLPATPVYEIDLPANIDRKRTRLTRLYGEIPANVTLVPVDFETQDLADVLADHGYRPDRPTFFVWEAVTQYLTEAGVRRTFDFLAAAAPGSRLVFTYVRKDFLDGTALYGGESAYQEFVVKRQLWHFGMDPNQVAEFLADYGWRETEQMGRQEFAHRYVTPSGRALPVSEIERSVCARKI
jgi:methyltransferase (TIGR00027 family)